MDKLNEIKSAQIICVGTEILLGDILNTNTAYLARQLAKLGISVYRQSVVGDNPSRLLDEMREAYKHSDMIIFSGGLGPTCDDLTKETVSEYFGLPMYMDEHSLEQIQIYFHAIGREMTENNKKQALVPVGAEILENSCGTAPGIAIYDSKTNKTAILLPGPPVELCAMFEGSVRGYLRLRSRYVFASRNIHIFGIGESGAETILRKLMDNENPTVAPYAKAGEVRIRVTARAESEMSAYQLCDTMVQKVRDTEVGKYIYGIDCDSVEGALLPLLRKNKMKIACAESCTGGYIAKRITDIGGCSDVFLGGAVTYSNDVKIKLLGVMSESLQKYGAVSEDVAMQMAKGIRKALGADIGISTTGIAGPGGGTDEKPVGTVYVAISTAEGEKVKKLSLSAMRDRDYIRYTSSSHALMLALNYCNEKINNGL